MKKNYLILTAIVVLIAGALFYAIKTGHGPDSRKATQVLPTTQEHQTGTPTSTQPQAQAPQSEQEEETPTVEIPPEKQQLIGVKTAEVSVRPLRKIIRTVGLIEYDERRIATVNTKFEGWVEKLYVDYNGKYVKKGEPMADVYSPELVATQQEFINLLRWAKKSSTPPSPSLGKEENAVGDASFTEMLARDAGVMIEAAKQRLRLWDINEAQIKKIGESGKPIRTLTLYSPVNGYVVQKTALRGMKVMPEKSCSISPTFRLYG